MCGIVAYVGYESIADRILIEGLKILEYRGYDSAGIASFVNENIITVKTKGKVQQLEEKLQIQKIETSIGIAHTRWATHGEPNEINAHPHHVGKVTLVHNGIIENYYELKEELITKGYSFQSQSDSEIACAYIDYCYQHYHDKEEALIKAYQDLKGSFAFAILFADDNQNIYAMRKDSPLVLGTSATKTFIASDIQAFLHYTKQYIVLDHNEIARCSREGIVIKNLQKEFVKKEIQTAQMENKDLSKNGYAHYMLKEIHEQPYAIKETIQAYLSNRLEDLSNQFPNLKKFKQIHISACGSAMYAGMIAKVLIEKKARIPVQCIVASEYRYMDPIFQEDTLLILISQSGETADTLAALHLAKQHHVPTLAIVNVENSALAREADYVLYTHAGIEISVATTKAYCTQVALLSLIACHLSYIHGYIDAKGEEQLLDEFKQLPILMDKLIHQDVYKEIATHLYQKEHVFLMGRGLDYALSMEGALKLKEISYIHCEAYAAGELKHGTISLIEKDTPIIVLCSDDSIYEKTMSNMKEVKARGAKIIVLATEDLPIAPDTYDVRLNIPKTDILLQGILTVIPLQLIAYETANMRGCEIDQPRNLAKSVTVE